MDDPSPERLRDARLVLAGAIAAAGKRESSVAWKGRVNSLIAEVAAMFGDRSSQMRRALAVLDAAVFTAVLVGIEFEESSKRIVVKLEHPVDKDHPDGVQAIRTERTDSQPGKMMQERLAQIGPGTTLLCWKVLEKMADGRKVAVLYHVETLPDRRGTGQQSAREVERPVSPAAPSRATERHDPTPDDIDDDAMAAFNEATSEWAVKTKVGIVRHLAKEKLWPPTIENLPKILDVVENWSF